MKADFAKDFVGWSFVAGALMLWLGWMLIGKHIGLFFEAGDFAEVHAHLHWWIWMYRIHLFGMVISVIALMALGSRLVETPARTVIWPGVAVASAGIFISAVAQAFYYHFGAWGSIAMAGKSNEEIGVFVESLRVTTEYVTCLVRFGRVFSGLGILFIGIGLLKWQLLGRLLGWVAVVIGLAAMGLTMGLPDRLDLYTPVFHLYSAWLLVMGIDMLRCGLRSID